MGGGAERPSPADEERRPSYSEAHIHVKSGDGAHSDVVEAIVTALNNYLQSNS